MKWPGVSLALLVTFLSANLLAQGVSVPSRPLPDKPFLVDSAEQRQIRVSVIKGLSFLLAHHSPVPAPHTQP